MSNLKVGLYLSFVVLSVITCICKLWQSYKDEETDRKGIEDKYPIVNEGETIDCFTDYTAPTEKEFYLVSNQKYHKGNRSIFWLWFFIVLTVVVAVEIK